MTICGGDLRRPSRCSLGSSRRVSGEGLRGHLNLPDPVDDPRLTKVEPLTRKLWFHRFVLNSPAELDETFLGWVHQATMIGQGQS